MTRQPCAPIRGDHSFDTAPPADIRQMSVAGEIVVVERLALQRPVAERDFPADRLGRGERDDFRDGKTPLGENGEHFATDIAGGADDRDLEA